MFIPRLKLSNVHGESVGPRPGDSPFTLWRRQFPIRLGFAMTINIPKGKVSVRSASICRHRALAMDSCTLLC